MAPYRDLWQELCSYSNLELVFKRARKHKTLRPYVIEFEDNLVDNLSLLRTELLLHSYKPKPLETFILRDPKTRKISKSDFRDRVVHHGTEFLGFTIFLNHKLIKLKTVRHFYRKFQYIYEKYCRGMAYDKAYEFIEGWIAYAKNANTYHLRQRIVSMVEDKFPQEISAKEINRHMREERRNSPGFNVS